MKKTLSCLIIGIFLISFCSAYQTHKQDTDFNLVIVSNNATQCNLTSIQNPNGTTLIFNNPLTQNGRTFNYLIDKSNFSNNGDICMSIVCYDGSTYEDGSVCRNVTPSGSELNTSQSLIFIFIIGLIFLFLYFSVFGIMGAVRGEWQIFYICMTYVLLFSLFFICWLFSNNYLYDTPIIASIFWIIWFILSLLFFPFIIFIGSYILKKQAEQLMVDDYKKQGYTHGEALEMSKRRRK